MPSTYTLKLGSTCMISLSNCKISSVFKLHLHGSHPCKCSLYSQKNEKGKYLGSYIARSGSIYFNNAWYKIHNEFLDQLLSIGKFRLKKWRGYAPPPKKWGGGGGGAIAPLPPPCMLLPLCLLLLLPHSMSPWPSNSSRPEVLNFGFSHCFREVVNPLINSWDIRDTLLDGMPGCIGIHIKWTKCQLCLICMNTLKSSKIRSLTNRSIPN